MKWSKVEDAPGTPREIYGWRVYLLAITASCGALLFGKEVPLPVLRAKPSPPSSILPTF